VSGCVPVCVREKRERAHHLRRVAADVGENYARQERCVASGLGFKVEELYGVEGLGMCLGLGV